MDSSLQFLCGLALSLLSASIGLPGHPEDGGPPPGAADTADTEILGRGTRIASVEVKAPRNPNSTIDPDDPEGDLEPLEGPGLDQGTVAHVAEQLTIELANEAAEADAPLTPPIGSADRLRRMYLAVGVSTRGQRGPYSARAAVPTSAAAANTVGGSAGVMPQARAMAARPLPDASGSTQSWTPQVWRMPVRPSGRWPISPAPPHAPRSTRPSITIPAPMPVPIVSVIETRAPAAAPMTE